MDEFRLMIEVSRQRATLYKNKKIERTYAISTSSRGTGTEVRSDRTPLGKFKIHKKIGAGEASGAVFKERVPTGELCTENPRSALWQSREDLVLSRILWLEGAEPANANTLERSIYVHGTNHEHLLGTTASHGSVRMSSRDVIELFERVTEGTEVEILA